MLVLLRKTTTVGEIKQLPLTIFKYKLMRIRLNMSKQKIGNLDMNSTPEWLTLEMLAMLISLE